MQMWNVVLVYITNMCQIAGKYQEIWKTKLDYESQKFTSKVETDLILGVQQFIIQSACNT